MDVEVREPLSLNGRHFADASLVVIEMNDRLTLSLSPAGVIEIEGWTEEGERVFQSHYDLNELDTRGRFPRAGE